MALSARTVQHLAAGVAVAVAYVPLAPAVLLFLHARDITREMFFDRRAWTIVIRTQCLAWFVASILVAASLLLVVPLLARKRRPLTLLSLAAPAAVAEVIRIIGLYSVIVSLGLTAHLLFTPAGAVVALLYAQLPFAVTLVWIALLDVDRDELLLAKSLSGRWGHAVGAAVLQPRLKQLFGASFVVSQLVSTDYVAPHVLGGASLSTTATTLVLLVFQSRELARVTVFVVQHGLASIGAAAVVAAVVLVVGRWLR